MDECICYEGFMKGDQVMLSLLHYGFLREVRDSSIGEILFMKLVYIWHSCLINWLEAYEHSYTYAHSAQERERRIKSGREWEKGRGRERNRKIDVWMAVLVNCKIIKHTLFDRCLQLFSIQRSWGWGGLVVPCCCSLTWPIRLLSAPTSFSNCLSLCCSMQRPFASLRFQ